MFGLQKPYKGDNPSLMLLSSRYFAIIRHSIKWKWFHFRKNIFQKKPTFKSELINVPHTKLFGVYLSKSNKGKLPVEEQLIFSFKKVFGKEPTVNELLQIKVDMTGENVIFVRSV